MRNFFKTLFVGLTALMIGATTVNAQTVCLSQNAESTPYTPSDWTFFGLPESTSSPLAGTRDWKSVGFRSGQDYYVRTPITCFAVFNSDDFSNLSFKYGAAWNGTNTTSDLNVEIKIIFTTGQQYTLYSGKLRDGNGSGTFNYSAVKPSPAMTITNYSNWFVQIKFTTDQTLTNNGYYVRIDDINIGCFTQCTLLSNNQNPVSNAGADQSTYVNTSITLNGSSSYDPGPSGDYITSYQWIVSEGDPANVSLGSATSASTSASFSATGTYKLQLQTVDANGGVDYDEVVITVAANDHLQASEYTLSSDNQGVAGTCHLGNWNVTRSSAAANAHTSGVIRAYFTISTDNNVTQEYYVEFSAGQTSSNGAVAVDHGNGGQCSSITSDSYVTHVTQN